MPEVAHQAVRLLITSFVIIAEGTAMHGNLAVILPNRSVG